MGYRPVGIRITVAACIYDFNFQFTDICSERFVAIYLVKSERNHRDLHVEESLKLKSPTSDQVWRTMT